MDRFGLCHYNNKLHRYIVIVAILLLFTSVLCKAQNNYYNLHDNCCLDFEDYLNVQEKAVFLDSISVISVFKFPLANIKDQNILSNFLKIVYSIDGLYQNDVIGQLFYIGKLAETSFESNNHHLFLFYQPKFILSDPDNFSLYLFNTYENKITSIIEVASQLLQFDFIAYSKYLKLNNGELLIENISFPNDEDEKRVRTVKYFKIDVMGKIEKITQ